MFFRSKKNVARRSVRRLGVESLEARQLMVGDFLVFDGDVAYYNVPEHRHIHPDVNGDGMLTIADPLAVVDELRTYGAGPYDWLEAEEGTFVDTNFDGARSVADLLNTIDPLREALQVGYTGRIVYDPLMGAGNPYDPVEVSTLQVVELFIGSVDTVVENQADVTVAAFEASSTGDELLLTSVSYAAVEGNLVNGTHWRLLADVDEDGDVDTVVAETLPQSGVLRFELGYPVDETTRFEVRMDVASSPATETLRVGLARVEAETVATGESVEWGVGHTDQILLHIRDSGTLEVRQDTTPVRERQVLLGAQTEDLLRIELRAEYEDVDVFYVGIDVEGEARSIDNLPIFVAGLPDPIGIATRSSAELGDTFGVRLQNRQLLVLEGEVLDVFIGARLKSDVLGGGSGQPFALSIDGVDAVMASGDWSGNAMDADFPDGPVQGPTHVTTGSKPDRFANANPDQDGSPIPTGVANIGQWAVHAARQLNTLNGLNKVVLETLTFEVDARNVAMDARGFRSFNKTDATNVAGIYRLERMDGTPIPVTGTVTGRFRVIFAGLGDTAVDTEIDSDATETFVLQGIVTDPHITGSAGACRDAIDNDGDGRVDFPSDPGCSGTEDMTEEDGTVAGPPHLQASLLLRDFNLVWRDWDAGTNVVHLGSDHADSVIPSTLYRS